MLNDTTTDKIHSLNESFRRNLVIGGTVLLTPGVTCLEPDCLAELLEAVRKFDNFKRCNDPHGEHDFGAIDQNAVGISGRSTATISQRGALAEAILVVLAIRPRNAS